MTSSLHQKSVTTTSPIQQQNANRIVPIIFLSSPDFITYSVNPAALKNLRSPLTLKEFYILHNCQFFMARFEDVADHEDWWSLKPILKMSIASFQLNELIIKCTSFILLQQLAILTRILFHLWINFVISAKCLTYSVITTSKTASPPGSWVNSLDESMSSWLNQDFMFVQRKLHPSENKYHFIVYGDQGKPVMWCIKLREGKINQIIENNSHHPTVFENYTRTLVLIL